MQVAGHLHPADRQHGRSQVHGVHQIVADRSRFDHPRPADDERAVDAAVVGPPLAPGQGAMVGPHEHRSGVAQPVLFEFVEQVAQQPVAVLDSGVHPGQRLPHLGGVGEIGRHLDLVEVDVVVVEEPRPSPGLMGVVQVEHREERLVGVGPVAPVASRQVPGGYGRDELVVGLVAVGAEVASRPQVLGKAAHIMGNHRLITGNALAAVMGTDVGAHVMGPQRHRVHAGDHRAARWRAHRRSGECLGPQAALGRQPVEIRGAGHRIAVAAESRRAILK